MKKMNLGIVIEQLLEIKATNLDYTTRIIIYNNIFIASVLLHLYIIIQLSFCCNKEILKDILKISNLCELFISVIATNDGTSM